MKGSTRDTRSAIVTKTRKPTEGNHAFCVSAGSPSGGDSRLHPSGLHSGTKCNALEISRKKRGNENK